MNMTTVLPEIFENQMKKSLANEDEFQHFCHSIHQVSPVSIRTNPSKINTILDQEVVPWCTMGRYLPKRPVFTIDPDFHAGTYYVQEASSMFILHILEQIVTQKTSINILDLCAAPGGKSTLIASWLNGQGLLVSNEVIKQRCYTLKYNLMKEGYANVVVTNNEVKDFASCGSFFDIILIDAPCSGEGMFRKDPASITHWSPDNVTHCAARQKNIISEIIPCLKSGGHLIYSTCTYNDHENMHNCDWMVKNFNVENVPISISGNWGITVKSSLTAVGYQFYPHKVKGEGFFVSVFKLTEDRSTPKGIKNLPKHLRKLEKNELEITKNWIHGDQMEFLKDITNTIHAFPSTEESKIWHLLHFLKLIYCGISVGMVNKNILIPDHSLALSHHLKPDFPEIGLDLNEAQKYLKKELFSIQCDQKSWLIAKYNGNGIGFLKNLGDRINNYLPNDYKILMNIGKNKATMDE
jgi:16S rRNA C967 or C1407 C5-methylase (RsmB/RsmF family)/NOL1/NOP2/fmu family ribosome biogenesis protein